MKVKPDNFHGCDTAWELFKLAADMCVFDQENAWKKYCYHAKTCPVCRASGGAYNELLDRIEQEEEEG